MAGITAAVGEVIMALQYQAPELAFSLIRALLITDIPIIAAFG
jgi:hypothetical protein